MEYGPIELSKDWCEFKLVIFWCLLMVHKDCKDKTGRIVFLSQILPTPNYPILYFPAKPKILHLLTI